MEQIRRLHQAGNLVLIPRHSPHSATLHSPLSLSYRDLFADRCYLLAELHCGPDDRRKLARLQEISRQTRIPLVAAGDVHYHVPERAVLHDVLTAIRHGCTVAEATRHLFPNAQRHLKSPAEMAALFADAPDGAAAARWRSPTAARFRSTNCGTSIPRSWPRRA